MQETEKIYEVRTSEISGDGLFAAKPISKGTKIVEYVGEVVSKEEGIKRDDESMKTTGKTYIFQLDKEHDIDGGVDYNDAKYANHSCDPNAKFVYEDRHIWIVAIKDIQPGDEITFNYEFEYDYEGEFKDYPCKCGSSRCVGYIAAEEDWDDMKEFLKKESEK